MTNEIQTLGHWELMGSRFTIFGTIDAPLFLAKEVAERIEHSDVSIMVRNVDEDEKLIGTIFLSGQNRDVWFLTEYGLYEVLMQSRKPVAKQFKAKVKEVLRELRRTGRYDGTKESVLPGGCTLDGEPVVTIQMAAEHFGVIDKAIYHYLYHASVFPGCKCTKGEDYFPATKEQFYKFKAQNPGALPETTHWITLLRVSGFLKLEKRFKERAELKGEPCPFPLLGEPEAEPDNRPRPKLTGRDALAANAKAQVAALSSLLRSYQRKTVTAKSRRSIAAAIEEAAESILVTARGMKTAAKEG